MSLPIFLYIRVILFHTVFSKSISNGTIENRTDALEKSFDLLNLRINNMSDILKNLQTRKLPSNNIVGVIGTKNQKNMIIKQAAEYTENSEIPTEKKRPLFYIELRGNIHLQTNSIVKFDTQVIDEGNNFNTGDGIFVAPLSGIYSFSWSIQTHLSQNVQTELRVDNIVKGKQLMNLGAGAGYFATTRNVFCTVHKGDHVWIQTDNHYTDNYFNELGGGVRGSFMGLFIQEL